jgi:hypothetical protein
VGHLQTEGFTVKPDNVSQAQLTAIKNKYGVPRGLRSCHTGIVDNYIIEGHVPAAVVARLLREKPNVAGLAVPGMPAGSPGMESPNPRPYNVFSFDRDGHVEIYDRVRP